MAYGKPEKSKIGPREAQLREMREQRAESQGKTGKVARTAKKGGKVAKKRIGGRGR